MMETFQYLAPVYLTQILLGVLLLILFVRDRDEVGTGKILLTSLLYTALNILIEWFLNDYLLAATLVVQWTLFVLLANRIISIDLPRASMTLFCYFSLLMGFSMLEARFSPEELTQEEKLLTEGFDENSKSDKKDLPKQDWITRLEHGSLPRKIYSTRNWVIEYLYHPETEEPVSTVSSPAPTPALPPLPHPENPDPAKTVTLSGKEFEALFFPEKNTAQTPQEIPTSTPTLPKPTENYPTVPPNGGRNTNGINAEQMSEIVKIRNRSTDPGYAPPEYYISAIGMGSGGHFAIVDGDMLREGSVIYTQKEKPRAWRLYRIEVNQVFWQPLK